MAKKLKKRPKKKAVESNARSGVDIQPEILAQPMAVHRSLGLRLDGMPKPDHSIRKHTPWSNSSRRLLFTARRRLADATARSSPRGGNESQLQSPSRRAQGSEGGMGQSDHEILNFGPTQDAYLQLSMLITEGFRAQGHLLQTGMQALTSAAQSLATSVSAIASVTEKLSDGLEAFRNESISLAQSASKIASAVSALSETVALDRKLPVALGAPQPHFLSEKSKNSRVYVPPHQRHQLNKDIQNKVDVYRIGNMLAVARDHVPLGLGPNKKDASVHVESSCNENLSILGHAGTELG